MSARWKGYASFEVATSVVDGFETSRFAQGSMQRGHCGAHVGGTLREAPVERRQRLRVSQQLHELAAGVVGKVQIVDDVRRQRGAPRLDQGRADGTLRS